MKYRCVRFKGPPGRCEGDQAIIMISVRRNILFWLFGLLLIGSAAARAQSPSNQELLARLFITPVLNVLSDSLTPASRLVIAPPAPAGDSLNVWLQQILTDSCLSRNYLVYSTPDSTDGGARMIAMETPRARIRYMPGGRKWLLWGRGRKKRLVESHFHLTITDGQHQVLYSKPISGNYQDVIPASAVAAVEKDPFRFTKGTKSGSKFIKRWLEPVLITAATTTVFYMFYSLRSDK